MKNKSFSDIKKVECHTKKLVLTTKDRCDCDKLFIDNCDQKEIKNMIFKFEFYNYKNFRTYLITIINEKEENSFLGRFFKKNNSRNWTIRVEELDEKGNIILKTDEKHVGTMEVCMIKKILENIDESFEKILVDFLKHHKYTNLKALFDNLSFNQ